MILFSASWQEQIVNLTKVFQSFSTRKFLQIEEAFLGKIISPSEEKSNTETIQATPWYMIPKTNEEIKSSLKALLTDTSFLGTVLAQGPVTKDKPIAYATQDIDR